MTLYYVQSDGNNSNAGTATGSANAWADPGYASGQMGEGDWCYVKSATYALTNATPGTAGGPVKFTAAVGKRCGMEAYGTTPGDLAGTATLSAGSQEELTLFEGAGAVYEPHRFIGFEADANGQDDVVGFEAASVAYNQATWCRATDCETGFSAIMATLCRVTDCDTGFTGAQPQFCAATDCYYGIVEAANGMALACVASGCASYGINMGGGGHLTHCVAHDNAGDGFKVVNGSVAMGCVATLNGGYGFNTSDAAQLLGCAGPGSGSTGIANTSGNLNATPQVNHGWIDLTVDPFVDSSNGDFRPNHLAGGGALLRAAGYGVAGQTDARDVGAVQHADPWQRWPRMRLAT